MAKKRGSGARGFVVGVIVGITIGAVATLVLTQPTENGAANPGAAPNIDALAAQLRERYEVAMALGHDAYERAREEVLTRYNKARSTGA